MATVTVSPERQERAARQWRVRAGIARTFGPLFVVLSMLLAMLGAVLLYDAYAYPLTADGVQVLTGGLSLASALLLFGYWWREGR
jgi:hypothetical protein